MLKRRHFKNRFEDDDPLSGMANLFDAAMVFAVALMVAAVSRFGMTEMLSNEDMTVVKNPGKSNMEIIVKKGTKIDKYRGSGESGEGKGRKVGTAYELENGEIIYVPE